MKLLHFHIGRGGRFNNGGHKTFKGWVDEITEILPETVSYIPEYGKVGKLVGGNELYDDWVDFVHGYEKDQEEIINLKKYKELKKTFKESKLELDDFFAFKLDNMGGESFDLAFSEDGTGFINWDHEYNTDLVKSLTECDEKEVLLMLKEETRFDFESYELEMIKGNLIDYCQQNDFFEALDLMQYFVVEVEINGHYSYYNGSMTGDEYMTEHIDQAEGFENEEEAKENFDHIKKCLNRLEYENVNLKVVEAL